MRGKSKKLLNSDKPKVSENPNLILNFKEHHVTSHSRPGSSVYGHCSESDGVFERLALSRVIEQPVTFESSGEAMPASVHCYLPLEGTLSRAVEQPVTYQSSRQVMPASADCYLPLEGISSQVSWSTSCDLKRKSQPDDTFDAFDRYSQLCTRNVFPRRSSSSSHLSTSSNAGGTNNDKSTDTVFKDCLNTAFIQNENLSCEWSNMISKGKSLGKEIMLDFEHSAVCLGSDERELERLLLKPRHIRDDRYGCLFQQSGSVETQGQSSGPGDEPHIVNANVNASPEAFLLTTTSGAAFRPTGTVYAGVPATRPSKRSHSDVWQGIVPSEGSPLKRSHLCTSTVTNRSTSRFRRAAARQNSSAHIGGVSYVYDDIGDCDRWCHHCGAKFWFGERLKGHSNSSTTVYHLCCGGGRIYMEPTPDPPEYIKGLLRNKHFMENIQAYNQMFAMTSFGAKIDESINNERGPYVFKVSGQVYHWIGSLCPLAGETGTAL